MRDAALAARDVKWVTRVFEGQWGVEDMAQQPKSGEAHPADALGTALVRATGVLSALTACQDSSRGTFALNEQFLVQAIGALEGFVADARNAYFDLCNTCDLSFRAGEAPKREIPAQPQDDAGFREEQAIFVPDDPPPPQMALPDLYAFRQVEAGTAPVPAPPADLTPDYATSYDDLLRKLTAVEIFAAERGRASADASGSLLPLLKSLRQDIERFRAA